MPANILNGFILGSVRIVAAGTIVVGSNSGIIADVLHNGNGDDTWTLNIENQIGPDDVVDVRCEEAAPGIWSVERLTALTFRVRIVDDLGAGLAANYGLNILRRLEG